MIYNCENVTKITGTVDGRDESVLSIVEIDTVNKTVLAYKRNIKGQLFALGDEIASELLKPSRVNLLIDGVTVKWGQVAK